MRGQVTVEFLVVTAGLLAVYAAVLPFFASSFQKASSQFNDDICSSIVSQIEWKVQEVELLEDGAVLFSELNSPVDFNFSMNGKSLNVERGVNVFQFTKMNGVVLVQLK